MKASFVLYTDYADQIKMLSNEDAGILLKDIMQYARDNVEPQYTSEQGMIKMAFSFIRAQLDRDSDKYEETIEKRREAGRQGGLASASKRKQNQANGSKTKQSQANQADNVNVNVNVNDNDNVNVNEKEKKKKTCTQEQKHCFGEYNNVKLTHDQYTKLGVDFGEVKRALLIKRLDEYMKEKPNYKSQDHNLAIRRWVVRAVEEDAQRDAGKNNKRSTVFHNFDMKHNYDFDNMEQQLLKGE